MGIRSWLIRMLGGGIRPADVQPMRGQDLFVNLPADSSAAVERHLARIVNCMRALRKADVSDERRESLLSEITRRKRQLAVVGIEVPAGLAKVQEMLDTHRAGMREE
ncbi:MAG TPA: hypothetical protein ENJ18_10570 [Nannocystis exedens]|nr:hypothetical protein [Nannocystis exedens]